MELLLVLSLFALCFCFVFGFNHSFFEKNKRDRLEKEVMNSIDYARESAMISGQDLTLNPIDASDNWSSGMILFVDNVSHHYTEQDKVIYRWQWSSSPHLKLLWRGFQSTKYLIFSNTLRRSIVNGHFVILKDGVEVRRIILNRLGRVVVE